MMMRERWREQKKLWLLKRRKRHDDYSLVQHWKIIIKREVKIWFILHGNLHRYSYVCMYICMLSDKKEKNMWSFIEDTSQWSPKRRNCAVEKNEIIYRVVWLFLGFLYLLGIRVSFVKFLYPYKHIYLLELGFLCGTKYIPQKSI